jgi:hypothetical protein
MYDSDLNSFAQEVSANNVHSGTGAIVTFYPKTREVPAKTREMGKPQYETVDYVRIQFPGVKDFPDRPVREEDKFAYPVQWARYKNTEESAQKVDGTPIEEWTRIDRSRAAELKAQKFFTVEQIAKCRDDQAKQLGFDGMTLRAQAIAYLEESKGGAATQKLAAKNAELEASLEQKEQELKTQRDLIEKMAKRLDSLEANAEREMVAKVKKKSK